MDTKGKRAVGGMNWETIINTSTLLILCVKQTTNKELTVEHRELYSVLCGDLDGKETELIHFAVQQKLT